MNTYFNIAIIAVFAVMSVLMLTRYFKVNKKVMISDRQWSTFRIVFLILGLFSVFSLISSAVSKTTLDYARLIVTVILVSIYLLMKDGVGEEGVVAGGKFFPWNIVRSYDWEERKNLVAVYFTVESTNEKKPDEYTTKELDFALEDKDMLMRFLQVNCGRKYTRMKKKRK